MPAGQPPVIVLVRPQLGMNIGMAARAMANFGLRDLRLVAPRDGWPNPEAGPPAAGADWVLDRATVHERVAEALTGCQLTFATTMLHREAQKPVVGAREAAEMIRAGAARGLASAILFGPERSGLSVDDIAAIQTLVTFKTAADFASLNLAMSVLVVAHEWHQAAAPASQPIDQPAPAPHEDLAGLIAHLDAALDRAGYFHIPDRTPATRRTLATMLARPGFTAQEVRTLRGIIRALEEGPRRRR
jgi:tRNA/rRNA methyltransferase